MRIARLATLASLLGVAAGAADAQVNPAAAHLRLRQSLDAPTYQAVSRIVETADARGIPVEPLLNRALQGALHRTPGPRVQDAVAKLADRLAIAQAALGPGSSAAEISAGANALAVGVPHGTLVEIRRLSSGRPVTVPLGVLTELIAKKVAVRDASRMVAALMRNGATAAQLVSLSDDVKHDVDAGIAPGAALHIRTRGVLGTLEQSLSDEDLRVAMPTQTTSGSSSGQPPSKVPRKP